MEEGEFQLEEGEEVEDSSEENGADDINSPENSALLNGSEEDQVKNEESLEFGNELDFEEGEKESGEEGEDLDEDDVTKGTQIRESKEDGELSEEEEEDPLLRQEPKTVCRFFNKGQCTWGTNCRFLHPGVSDKGNYNMFAPAKAPAQTENTEETPEKERQPREVRPFVQEPSFESAWERGLRHAKEMMKRASKRKETDADFEEKRFNLSLGQAELDRENDYYTRPASPVHKAVDVEYPDPYERQAIRHFRGGHIENIEVRYNVEPSFPTRGGHMRSRREKFDREVTERMPRRIRPLPSPQVLDHPRIIKEKRYPRPRTWSGDKGPPSGDIKEEGKQEAETWADPWARRHSPAKVGKRKEQRPRSRRSYSTGSSSRSSRSSRSSSYSSFTRSGSSSRSSKSPSSRSITPPVHPRQRALANRGRGARTGDRAMGHPGGPGAGRGRYPNQTSESYGRPAPLRRPDVDLKENKMLRIAEMKGQMVRQPRDRLLPKIENRQQQQQQQQQQQPPPPVVQRLPLRKPDPRIPPEMSERVDMFGRTIRKENPVSPPRSISRSPVRRARKFSNSHSRSFSGESRSSPSSSSVSSRSPSPSPPRRKDQRIKMTEGTVSYGQSMKKSKTVEVVKVTPKPQSKLTLKRQGPVRREKTIVSVEDDSGESDTGGKILRKRKADVIELDDAPMAKIMKEIDPTELLRAAIAKKPQGRREELLKQLRAVEDAIARKRGKPII